MLRNVQNGLEVLSRISECIRQYQVQNQNHQYQLTKPKSQ